MPLSRSQVNRLGERLRGGTESDGDLAALATYQAEFDALLTDTMNVVNDVVAEAVGHPVHVSGRSKQLRSIVEKLRRGTTRLAQLYDIVGCRVVLPTRQEQDAAADAFSGLQGWAIHDFRTSPHSGYWAIHIIRSVDDKQVEVQLRTDVQHHWAELSETLDRAFPGVKYGAGDPQVLQVLEQASGLFRTFEQSGWEQQPADRDLAVGLLADKKREIEAILSMRP